MRKTIAFLLLVACDARPLSPMAADSARCAIAHGAATAACSPQAADPLAEPGCADVVREMIRACVPPSWRPPK